MASLHPDKHAAILDAAQKRFACFGLTKVTMDEIAVDLAISKAALYYYFETKEEIFRQVIAREQQEFITRVEVIIKKDCTAAEMLRHYFRQHHSLLNELLNLRIVSCQSERVIHPIMRDLFREFARKERALLETILDNGKKHREFALESAETTAMMLQHVLAGLRLRFFKTAGSGEIGSREVKSFSREIKLFAKIFIQGITR
jgi:TetR/AcrR family transcriptional regulator